MIDNITDDRDTYAPIPKAISTFIGSYSPTSISVYTYMTLTADWTPGSRRGTLETSILDLSRVLHLSRPTVRSAIRELSLGYLSGIPSRNGRPAPPLIRIIDQTGRTQKKRFTIRILSSRELKINLLARAREESGDSEENRIGGSIGIGKVLFE